MTHLEAMQAMDAGHKVAHKYFTRGEYLHKVGGNYVCEQGCVFTPRNSDQLAGKNFFAAGWSIWEPK